MLNGTVISIPCVLTGFFKLIRQIEDLQGKIAGPFLWLDQSIMSAMVDNIYESRSGWWFGSSPENESLFAPHSLWKARESIIQTYLKRNPLTNATSVSSVEVGRLRAKINQIKLYMALAMHISSGQPARGPELLEIQYRYTASQVRNVFMLYGQLT